MAFPRHKGVEAGNRRLGTGLLSACVPGRAGTEVAFSPFRTLPEFILLT